MLNSYETSGTSPTSFKRVTLILAALLSLLFLSLPSPAQSQPRASFRKTGNELYSDCQGAIAALRGQPDFSPARAAACVNYISGVADAETLNINLCIPQEVTTGQLAQIVWNYLDKYPEYRHRPAVNSVWAALLLAGFVCR